MRRPWFILLALVALVVALGWIASARLASETDVQNGELVLAAVVRAESASVLAPALASVTSTRGASTGSTAGGSAAGGSGAVVAGALVSVDVSAGARVSAGQVVARLDDTTLRMQLDIAKAAARGAHARVGVVDSNIDALNDNAATLADSKKKLDSTLASLRASRAEVVANLAKARAALASLPTTVPPALPPGVPDPRAAAAQLRTTIAQLEAALAKLDSGLAQATSARAKLDSGEAKIADARAQLRDARDLTVLAAKAADAGVDLAEARVALAVLRAPYSGVVTFAAERGSVLFVGGPVVRIAPDGPLLLDTYLDTSEASLVSVGSSARAGSDSFPGRSFGGHVSAIRPVYEYPPTSLPTRLIHMTRAFRVTVTIDDTAAPLPAGTPVDLTISVRS